MNTEKEMDRYDDEAVPFVRLWPHYESNVFVQKKVYDKRREWTTREYYVEPLSLFGNQQYMEYSRTLDLPNYKYTDMYALGYDFIIFTYNDWDHPSDPDVFQIYECPEEETTCTKHFEYSVEDDVEHNRDRKFANKFVAWKRETITDIFYMVESDDSGEFFLNFMRYYPEFEDPIVYEVKDIPLE